MGAVENERWIRSSIWARYLYRELDAGDFVSALTLNDGHSGHEGKTILASLINDTSHATMKGVKDVK